MLAFQGGPVGAIMSALFAGAQSAEPGPGQSSCQTASVAATAAGGLIAASPSVAEQCPGQDPCQMASVAASAVGRGPFPATQCAERSAYAMQDGLIAANPSVAGFGPGQHNPIAACPSVAGPGPEQHPFQVAWIGFCALDAVQLCAGKILSFLSFCGQGLG